MADKILDAAVPQKVTYCIPMWLRDEQIRVNTERVKARIQPHETRDEPIAIVCFGPSLCDTWEQVRAFRYVMTCSGAHKFMVERGIMPTWHVEVDPRAHKVGLMGPPQRETEYLLSSTCHPSVLDHLDGYTVKLWHVFDATQDGQRLLPPDEWAITGGCDVGLRCLTLAAFLGFRDLQVFGMDQSAGTTEAPTARRHADEHPHGGKHFSLCTYDGVTYRTTQAMLEAARGVPHELDMLPGITATFHGDGLCQHMMRNHVPKPAPDRMKAFENMIAFNKPATISAEYAALNAQLHRENLAYGVGGGTHAPIVRQLREKCRCQSVLDYGCGKGYLSKALEFPIWEYDPAIPTKSAAPRAADLVVCTDVLEHIEPDRLRYVLGDLSRCVQKVGYFVIHTGPAAKRLPDGRNTHLIQRGESWWRRKLEQFFEVGSIKKHGAELLVIVGPKRKAMAS